MAEIASVAAVILALIMAYAAFTKLTDHQTTTESFRQLGLPQPNLVAWAVPTAELALAVALLAVPGWGGVGSFVLLVGFTTYLGLLVRSGVEVSCGCFGSTSSEPVSVAEIGRNLTLLGLAGLAASQTTLVRPSLSAVIVVTSGCLIALTLAQLVALHNQVGSLFRLELAGEGQA